MASYVTIDIYDRGELEVREGDDIETPSGHAIIAGIAGDYVTVKYDDGDQGSLPVSSIIFTGRKVEK